MEEKKFQPYIPADKVVPEFTVFSVILGALLAVLFGGANAYLGLRVGMTVSASIPAAVISMGVIRFIFKRDSILENNMVQTIGSAGESLAAGAIFTMPALFMWAADGLCYMPSLIDIGLIALCGGLLGVLMMIPLRSALIVKEHGTLGYPEGTACAEVLLAGEEGGANASTVFSGMGLAAVFKFIVDGLGAIPADIAVVFKSFKGALGVEAYPALLSVGYIVGPKTASYMFSGSMIGWMVIIPLICLFGENIWLYPAAAGVTVSELYAAGGAGAIWSTYVKYIGAGAIATGGIISLIKSLPLIVSTFRDSMKSLKGGSAEGTACTDKDLPMPLILGGILAIILIIWLAPAVPVNPLGALLIVIFGFFFSTVSARMVGMVGSSNNPVSGMTIAALLVATFFLLATGVTGSRGMVSAILIGSVVCVIVSVSSDTSQDLKTGFLLGATPRTQQIGELIGVVASAAAIGAVLNLLNTAWGFGTGELGAPQAMMMKMIVEGVMGGNMPWTLVFLGVFLAVVLELLGLPILPVAIGVYLPVHMTAGIMLGGLVREIVDRLPLGKNADREEGVQAGILYSSGLIAGEGLVGIVLAVLTVLGVNIDLSGVFSLGNAGTLVLYGLLALSLIFVARRNGEKK